MCGIYLAIGPFACHFPACILPDGSDAPSQSDWPTTTALPQLTCSDGTGALMRRRGPDGEEALAFACAPASPDGPPISASATAWLLQLRGTTRTSPIRRGARGAALLFNGEVYAGLSRADPQSNDGDVLLRDLTAAAETDSVAALMSGLRGPWAVVFWDAPRRRVWFGRDVLGRRSLLLLPPQRETGGVMILTSVAPGGSGRAVELPPGLYSMDLDNPTDVRVQEHPWESTVPARIAAFDRPSSLVSPRHGVPAGDVSDAVLRALRKAVEVRCMQTDFGARMRRSGAAEARVLVLFSGGVDSTLIAALAALALPEHEPIDLCNVCFDGGASPDRLAALDALGELRGVFPRRQWRLVLADATLQDADDARDHLAALLAPAHTVMDANIGVALWLAARGQGRLAAGCDGAGEAAYTSGARVALLGHGADELFAGYGRHRTRFREGGWQGLSDELGVDIRRMWIRNCGRDDRLVADTSREARHPFLDEDVVLQALNTPLPELADLTKPPGEGDKLPLRAALRSLGLPRAAARAKRAIQFGSRIGKLANRRDFGSNRRANRLHAGSLPAEGGRE